MIWRVLNHLCIPDRSHSRSVVLHRWDTPQRRSSCGGSAQVLRRSQDSAHPAREIPPHRTGSFCNKLRGYRRPARNSRPLSTFSDHKVHKLRRHPLIQIVIPFHAPKPSFLVALKGDSHYTKISRSIQADELKCNVLVKLPKHDFSAASLGPHARITIYRILCVDNINILW